MVFYVELLTDYTRLTKNKLGDVNILLLIKVAKGLQQL